MRLFLSSNYKVSFPSEIEAFFFLTVLAKRIVILQKQSLSTSPSCHRKTGFFSSAEKGEKKPVNPANGFSCVLNQNPDLSWILFGYLIWQSNFRLSYSTNLSGI